MLYTLFRTRAGVLVFLLLLAPLRIACSQLHQYFHYVSDSCTGYETIIEDAYLQVNDIAIEAESVLRDPNRSVSRLGLIRLFFAADLLPESRIELPESEVLNEALEGRISKPLAIYERISNLKNKKIEARLYCLDDFLQWFPSSGAYYNHDSQKTIRGLSQGKTCSSGNDAFVIIDDDSGSIGADDGFFTLVLCPSALSMESRSPGKLESVSPSLDASSVSSYHRTLSVSILRELTRVGKINTRDHLVSIPNGEVKEANDWEGCTELAASNGTLAVDNAENYAAFGFACFTHDYLISNRYVDKRKGRVRNRRSVKGKSDGNASKCQNMTHIWTSTFTLTITQTLNNAWAQPFVTTSDSSSKNGEQDSESTSYIRSNWYTNEEEHQNGGSTTSQGSRVGYDNSHTSTGLSQFWNEARSSITSQRYGHRQDGDSSWTTHEPWQHDNSIGSRSPMSHSETNQGDHTTGMSRNNAQQRDGGSSHATSHSHQPYWSLRSSTSTTIQWSEDKGSSPISYYERHTWENSASQVQTSKDWSQAAYHEEVPRSSTSPWPRHKDLVTTQNAVTWKPQSDESPSGNSETSYESSWQYKKTSPSWYQDYSSTTATWEDRFGSTPSWNYESSSSSQEQDRSSDSNTWQGHGSTTQSWIGGTSRTSGTSPSWDQGHSGVSSTWVDHKDSASSGKQDYPDAQTTWQYQKSSHTSWIQWHTTTSMSREKTQSDIPSWKQGYANTYSTWHDHGNNGQSWEQWHSSTSVSRRDHDISTPPWEQWQSSSSTSWKNIESSTSSREQGYPHASIARTSTRSDISSWWQWHSDTSTSSWVNQRSSTPSWDKGYISYSATWNNGQSSIPAWEPEHTAGSQTWQARTSSSSRPRHQGHNVNSPTPNSRAGQGHQSSAWGGTPETYTPRTWSPDRQKTSNVYISIHNTSPNWDHEISASTSASSIYRSLHRSIRSTTSIDWNKDQSSGNSGLSKTWDDGNGNIARSSSLADGGQYANKGGVHASTTTTDYGQLKSGGTPTDSTTTKTEYYQGGSSTTSMSIIPDRGSTKEHETSSYKRHSSTSQSEVYWNPSITFDQNGNDATLLPTSSHGWRSSSTSPQSSYPTSDHGAEQFSFPTYQLSISNNGLSVSANPRDQTQSAHSGNSFHTSLLPISPSPNSDSKLEITHKTQRTSSTGGSIIESSTNSFYPSASLHRPSSHSSQIAFPVSVSSSTSDALPYWSTSSSIAFFHPEGELSKYSSSPFTVTSNSLSVSPSSSSWLAPPVITTNAFFQPPRWSSELAQDPLPSLSTSSNGPPYSPPTSHGKEPFASSEGQSFLPVPSSSTESVLPLPATTPSLAQPSHSFTERPFPISIPPSVHMLPIPRASTESSVDSSMPLIAASSTKLFVPIPTSSSVHMLQIPAASVDLSLPLPSTSSTSPFIPIRGMSLSNQVVPSDLLSRISPAHLSPQGTSSINVPPPLPTSTSINLLIPLSTSLSTSQPASLPPSSSSNLPLLPPISSSADPFLPLASVSSTSPLPLPHISSVAPLESVLAVTSSPRLQLPTILSPTTLLPLPTTSSTRPYLSIPTSLSSALTLPVPTSSSRILSLPTSIISSTAPLISDMSSTRPLLPLSTSSSNIINAFPSSSSAFPKLPPPASSSKVPSLPQPTSSLIAPTSRLPSSSSSLLDPLSTFSSSFEPFPVPTSSPTISVPLMSASSTAPALLRSSSTAFPVSMPTSSPIIIISNVILASSSTPGPLPTSPILPTTLPTSSSILPTSPSTSSLTPVIYGSSSSSQSLPVPLSSSISSSATTSDPPISSAQPSSSGACHGSLWSSFQKIGTGVVELCDSYFSTTGFMSTVSTETLIPPPITITQVAPSTPVSATVTIVATSTSTDALNDPRALVQVTVVTGGVQKRQNDYNPIVWDGRTVMPDQVQSLCSCASITNGVNGTYLYLFSTTVPPSTTTVYQSALAPTTESTVTAPATAVATGCSSDYFQNFNSLDVGWSSAFAVLDASALATNKISCCNYCYTHGCFAFLWVDNPPTCEVAIGPGSATYEQGIPALRPQCPQGLIQAHGVVGGEPAKVVGNQLEYGPCLDTRAYA